jgi:hypothetical protein
LDWLNRNPEASLLRLPWEVRDWLAPDQWDGLVDAATNGWVRTDPDTYERLDRHAVYRPQEFAGVDLGRYRLLLDDGDYGRLVAVQQTRAEGRTDLAQIRWSHTRVGIDRALDAKGIDTTGTEAIAVRAEGRDRLDGFEAVEGRPPVGADLDEIARRVVEPLAAASSNTAPAVSETPLQETAAKEVFVPQARPRIVHNDDGSAEVTVGEVPTPRGPAEATVQIDPDRLGASAEMVLPGGHRVESRRTSSDGRTWSQIDTIRDPQGAVVGIQTTTFDGRRLTQTWEPSNGPLQTTSRDVGKADGDVHLASDEAVLGLGSLGAMAALPAAPLAAGAIVIGLGAYAAYRAYQHFTAPGAEVQLPDTTIAPATSADDDAAEDETGSGRRSRDGRGGGQDQEPDDESPSEPPTNREFKKRKPRQSGKEAATEIPDWAKQMGAKPYADETPDDGAARIMNQKYGEGNWRRGPSTEFSKIKKFFSRAFQDPQS